MRLELWRTTAVLGGDSAGRTGAALSFSTHRHQSDSVVTASPASLRLKLAAQTFARLLDAAPSAAGTAAAAHPPLVTGVNYKQWHIAEWPNCHSAAHGSTEQTRRPDDAVTLAIRNSRAPRQVLLLPALAMNCHSLLCVVKPTHRRVPGAQALLLGAAGSLWLRVEHGSPKTGDMATELRLLHVDPLASLLRARQRLAWALAVHCGRLSHDARVVPMDVAQCVRKHTASRVYQLGAWLPLHQAMMDGHFFIQ